MNTINRNTTPPRTDATMMISVCSLSMVSGSTGGGGADVVGGELLLLLLSVVIRSSVVVVASGVCGVVIIVLSSTVEVSVSVVVSFIFQKIMFYGVVLN